VRSDIALVVWRIALVYAALGLCRLAFLAYNRVDIGAISSPEVWSLLKGSLVFDTVSVIYTNALFVVASLVPFRFRANRWWRGGVFGYWVVVNSVSVAINLSDAVYYHYTHKRFTADELFFAGNDNTFGLVLKFMAENWYLVLLWLALTVALVLLYGRRVTPATPIRQKWAYFGVNLAVLAGACALCVGGVRGGFSRMTRPITLSNATQYATSPAKANLILSNPFAIIRTAGRSAGIAFEHYFSPEELATIYTPYHYPTPQKIATPPNIVVFILESFSAEHSAFLNPDIYAGEAGYTPFLDSLMRGGYTFTNAHANGHKSIEALPAVLGSIPSFRTPFVLMPQSLGVSRQLPQILADRGYPTLFFNGSERGSMGFEAYVRSAGVQTVYSREEYETARGRGDFDGFWGIWDEPFLDWMGEVLGEVEQPFFSAVFTLSSHHPFVVPAEYEHLPAGRTKIHRPVQYTDGAIRHFFEKYGSTEWFANTVFAFVADHVSSETFAPKTLTPTGRTRIVQFLYKSDGSLRGIDGRVAQQTDLMPTLMNFVPDAPSFFAFGRDAFARDVFERDVLDELARKPLVVTFSEGFVAQTDSVVVFFDGERVTRAFGASDIFMERDILSLDNLEIADTERLLKAVIQQYYTHIEQMNYTVPASEQ
jgi:phosphoglycerol transferase MdoB-like AlkP superfamily enzyme